MASNSTQLGCANSSYKYTLSVDWSESDTNIANNTTKISASGSLSASNVGFDALYNSYACHLKLYWHDNNKNTDTLFATSGAFTTCGMGYGTRTVSGSITVTHKSDGSLSGYVKVYFDAPTTSGGWSPSSSSCSTGWTTCTTIARASSISGLSGNQLNSGVSVTIDRKSSSFTHKVEYKFVNSGWTTVSSNAATSCAFTPPLSLASQIPSATSGALTVRVTTYNGSTQIGSSVTKSINLSVPSTVVPSLSGLSATRIDNDIPSSWGLYVKGISQVKITASGASGSYGSKISGYSISGPGLYTNSSSGTSGQLSSTGTQTYTCTVTDSRGRKASKSVSITVVDYSYPSISMSVERCKSDGTKDTSGTYLRVVINYGIASVSGKNSIASKSCSCNGVSNSSFASGTAFVLSANCSIGSHYAVNASIRDALGRTASASAEVNTAYRVLNVNKNKDGVAIGKFSEKAAFEVNMDAYLLKDLEVGGKVRANSLYSKNGLAFDGNFEPCKVISGGGSGAAFIKLCKITIKDVYINYPLEITYFQRGSSAATTLCIMFESSNDLDPGVSTFRYEGECLAAYIVKAATSTWDIYIKKSQSWDWIGFQHWAFPSDGIHVTPIGENATSVPNGWTQAVNFYMEKLRDRLFPVGAVYITYNNNNPGNFLGGTWVQFGKGQTLVGQGQFTDKNKTTYTFAEGETGGEYKHKLTVAEMPSHNHRQHVAAATGNTAGYQRYDYSGEGNSNLYDALHDTQNRGGDGYHNNLQPYITVYFWRRTA